MAGDLQTDSTPFDPLPQFMICQRESSSTQIVGTCWFGPIGCGFVFSRSATRDEHGDWRERSLTNPVMIDSIEIFEGMFVDELEQVFNARLHCQSPVDDDLVPGVLLIGDLTNPGGWRRGPRLWKRTPQA